MDEFKRTYSNSDTATVALPYFWTNLATNKEFYSIWYCEYKYNPELTLTFMSGNLIGGWYLKIFIFICPIKMMINKLSTFLHTEC